MHGLHIVSWCLMVLFSVQVVAASEEMRRDHDCARCHSLSEKDATEILKPLELTVKSVRHAPVSGMFEVRAEKAGSEGIIYIDYGKKYLMQGVIVAAPKSETVSSPSHPSSRENNTAGNERR